jgi:hypothetical protein
LEFFLKGGKVTVLRKGYVVTNNIFGTPTAGAAAYAAAHAAGGSAAGDIATSGTYQIGRFLSTKDEDGYAKVEVNLP